MRLLNKLFLLLLLTPYSFAKADEAWVTVENVLNDRTFYCREGSFLSTGNLAMFEGAKVSDIKLQFEVNGPDSESTPLIANITAKAQTKFGIFNQSNQVHFQKLSKVGNLFFRLVDQRLINPVSDDPSFDEYDRNIHKEIRVLRNTKEEVTSIKISKKSWKVTEQEPSQWTPELNCTVDLTQTY